MGGSGGKSACGAGCGGGCVVLGVKAGGGAGHGGCESVGGRGETRVLEGGSVLMAEVEDVLGAFRCWRMWWEKLNGMILPWQRGLGILTWTWRCVEEEGGGMWLLEEGGE